MPLALIASAGVNANEYLARHIAELGYPRPVIVASGGEARRRLAEQDFEIVVINTPPVSYTHLDVYTRQPLLSPFAAAGRQAFVLAVSLLYHEEGILRGLLAYFPLGRYTDRD